MMKIINSTQVQTQPLEITFASEVVYVPPRPGNLGGLFNLNRSPIPSAINHRARGEIQISACLDETINIDSLPVIENDEPFFYMGPIYGHYGHFLVESTARLWPLLNSHKDFSGKYLYFGAPSAFRSKVYIKQVFGAYSLAHKNFIAYPEPCRLKNVFIPAPSFEIDYSVHSLFRDTMQYIGGYLIGDLKKIHNTNTTPLYLSKSKLVAGLRGIINEIEIEEALRGMGVDILYPETMSLPDQIKELASRQFLLGTVGSALHTLVFCLGGKTISGVHFQGCFGKSFVMIDKLYNNTAYYSSIASQIELNKVSEKFEDASSRFQRAFKAQNPTKIAEQLLAPLQLV